MKTRKALLGLALALCSASLAAEVVTLPAAASLVGGSPFFSDVRVFNTSYASPLTVTAVYRCFIATVACPVVAPQIQFTLAPRESKAFNDICANAFGAPNTAGGVEFAFTGDEDQLVVTSRLYSTSPFNSVGMFIPGLHQLKAAASTVLTSIRHDPATSPPSGFRTNVGVFNSADSSAVATVLIFDFDGESVGTPVIRTVPGHSGAQVSGIFEAAGAAGLSTANATIVVNSTVPLFSYAAVLDNRTADPIFVVGAPNLSVPVTPGDTSTPTPTQPGQVSTKTRTPTMQGPVPTSTRTPTMGGPSPTRTSTATPTVSGPSRTPTPTVPTLTVTQTRTSFASLTMTRTPTPPATNTRTETQTPTPPPTPLPNQVNIGPGIAFSPSTITINAGDTVNWVWKSGPHSTTQGSCPGGVCTPTPMGWDSGIHSPPSAPPFSHTFPTAGTFTYYCKQHLSMMQGTVIVNP